MYVRKRLKKKKLMEERLSSLLQRCDSLPSFFYWHEVFFNVQEKGESLEGKIAELCSGLDSMSHTANGNTRSPYTVRLACDRFPVPSFLAPTGQSLNDCLYHSVHLPGIVWPTFFFFHTFQGQGGKETGCVRGGMMKRGGYKRSGLRT